MNLIALNLENPTILDSVWISLICMAIVFAMLALLWGICSLFRFIPQKKVEVKNVTPAPTAAAPAKQAIKFEDIKDEDMMVAALVATIEYHDETKEDVVVTSIKEI